MSIEEIKCEAKVVDKEGRVSLLVESDPDFDTSRKVIISILDPNASTPCPVSVWADELINAINFCADMPKRLDT